MSRFLGLAGFFVLLAGLTTWWQHRQTEEAVRVNLEGLRPTLLVQQARLISELKWMRSSLDSRLYQGFEWVVSLDPQKKVQRVEWSRDSKLDLDSRKKLNLEKITRFAQSGQLSLHILDGDLVGLYETLGARFAFGLERNFLSRLFQWPEAQRFFEVIDRDGLWIYHPLAAYWGLARPQKTGQDWQGQSIHSVSIDVPNTNLQLQLSSRLTTLLEGQRKALYQKWTLLFGLMLVGAGLLVLWDVPQKNSLPKEQAPPVALPPARKTVADPIAVAQQTAKEIATSRPEKKDPLVQIDLQELLQGILQPLKGRERFRSEFSNQSWKMWGHRLALQEFFAGVLDVLTEEMKNLARGDVFVKTSGADQKYFVEIHLPVPDLLQVSWMRLQSVKGGLYQDGGRMDVEKGHRGTTMKISLPANLSSVVRKDQTDFLPSLEQILAGAEELEPALPEKLEPVGVPNFRLPGVRLDSALENYEVVVRKPQKLGEPK